MYITPQTNIRLLRGCPLDPSYVHSIAFLNEGVQRTYMLGLTKYNLNNYTYQRYAKGKLRVQILADNLYDVNYMMFQNTAYGNKWFYAFVDKIEYINDVTTEVSYHLDEIQTWLFDWTFNQCFIERMHTTTDNVGDNITPEPVEVGEYVYNDFDNCDNFGGNETPRIIVGLTDIDTDYSYIADGNLYDGVYGGITLYAFPATASGVDDVNALITLYGKKTPDTIVTIYMVPHDAIDDANVNTDGSLNPIPMATLGAVKYETLGTCGTAVDGYTPRNKKLLTYPYNFQNVSNGEGDSLALRYEFFENNTAKVKMGSNITQPVQVYCCPSDYKGVKFDSEHAQRPDYDTDEKLVLSNYPSCSWNIDSWKVWWAQNAVPTVIKGIEAAGAIGITSYHGSTPSQEVGTGVMSAITGQEMTKTIEGTPAGLTWNKAGGLYALHTISNLAQSIYKASIQADVTKGNISSANAMFSQRDYGFKHGRMSVNHWQAEIIDSFFDRFGYSIHKIGTPSIRNRPAWTYIKTVDCTINGTIPVDSENTIENIINNGITFWTNPLYVADYSRSNTPVS